MIARAGRGRAPRWSAPDYIDAAVACAEFLLGQLRDAEGQAAAHLPEAPRCYLDDHAYLLEALLTLYEATFEVRWFVRRARWRDTLIERFADDEHGGFFTTAAEVDTAGRPPQGPRRLADPGRRLGGGVRAAAAGAR